MARTANPNREAIEETKAEMKTLKQTIKAADRATKKMEKLEERLAKLQSGEAPKRGRPAGSKNTESDKPAKTTKKNKAADSEKPSAKKFITKKVSNKKG